MSRRLFLLATSLLLFASTPFLAHASPKGKKIAYLFYDNPAGVAVNFLMSGMAMFPPVLRDPAKRAIRRGRIVAVARVLGGLPASSSAARDSRQRSGIAKTLPRLMRCSGS